MKVPVGVVLTESHRVAIFGWPGFGMDVIWHGYCHKPVNSWIEETSI